MGILGDIAAFLFMVIVILILLLMGNQLPKSEQDKVQRVRAFKFVKASGGASYKRW